MKQISLHDMIATFTRRTLILTLLSGAVLDATGHDVPRVAVSDLSLTLDAGTSGELRYSLLPSEHDLASEAELIITPVLVAQDSAASYRFPAAVIAGRNHFMRYRRGQRVLPEGAMLLRDNDHSRTTCTESFPYSDWMAHSVLYLNVEKQGCCGKPVERFSLPVAEVSRSRAAFSAPATFRLKAGAAADPKIVELKGSAFVDFRVNRTEIDSAYRRNSDELRKITETIDVVRDNPDATITGIRIKGFASPEGPYAANTRLAQGRTASLKDYIRGRYGYPESLFGTDFEPEDWAGLRDAVAASSLPGSAEMLDIIDSDLDPDAKDAALKRRHPDDYAYLLRNVYPALRRSDYVVTYSIRQYTAPEDIRRALREHPGNVSENELMTLLGACDPDSAEFGSIVEQGVCLFPKNSDLQYLRGVGLARSGDLHGAAEYLRRSAEAGVPEAAEALAGVEAMMSPRPAVRYVSAE